MDHVGGDDVVGELAGEYAAEGCVFSSARNSDGESLTIASAMSGVPATVWIKTVQGGMFGGWGAGPRIPPCRGPAAA